MSATVTCTNPRRCAVTSHRAGSAAARACARGDAAPVVLGAGAPPAPAAEPDWTGLALPAVVDRRVLLDALGEAARREGWDPDGAEVHPTGGYDRFEVNHVGAGSWEVGYRLGVYLHRADGPACHQRTADGQVGETVFIRAGADYLYLPGDQGADLAPRRFFELSRWCQDPLTAMNWLDLECRAGAVGLFQALEGHRGADPVRVLAAWEAGVRDLDALRAVATRRAPASWVARG